MARIGLRVDVDFHEGLRKGVPYLLDLFDRCGVRATFYVVMGPDTLARHSKRASSKKFRERILALNVLKIARHLGLAYLKSKYLQPQVGPDYPQLLREIKARGHELAIHGFDHAAWADGCYEWDREETRAEMDRAFDSFEQVMGFSGTSWGAPNWRANAAMFEFLCERGVAFSSDSRGGEPFLPIVAGQQFSLPQLPISLPCLHELVQIGTARAEIPNLVRGLVRDDYNVFCIHDYYEGLLERGLFAATLAELCEENALVPMGELATDYPASQLTGQCVERVLVPGGAREVSCAASFLEDNYFAALNGQAAAAVLG